MVLHVQKLSETIQLGVLVLGNFKFIQTSELLDQATHVRQEPFSLHSFCSQIHNLTHMHITKPSSTEATERVAHDISKAPARVLNNNPSSKFQRPKELHSLFACSYTIVDYKLK